MAESIFGIHERALHVRTYRAELLANNLANADTPNYKARDLDFRAAMQNAHEELRPSKSSSLNTTHSRHFEVEDFTSTSRFLKYRQPTQPSLDGNTVETHIEKSKFMENGMQHTATLEFINGKINSLRSALRGE